MLLLLPLFYIHSNSATLTRSQTTQYLLFIFHDPNMSSGDEVSVQLLLISSTGGRIIWAGLQRVVSVDVDESIIVHHLPHALNSWFDPHQLQRLRCNLLPPFLYPTVTMNYSMEPDSSLLPSRYDNDDTTRYYFTH